MNWGIAVKHSYTSEDDVLFRQCLSEMVAHPAIQALKQVPQHKGGTTYAHCVNGDAGLCFGAFPNGRTVYPPHR